MVGVTATVGVGAVVAGTVAVGTVLVGTETMVGTTPGVAEVLQARPSSRTARMPGQIFTADGNFKPNPIRSYCTLIR
jgi:hypothetical protein